jgi:hypothetical protein
MFLRESCHRSFGKTSFDQELISIRAIQDHPKGLQQEPPLPLWDEPTEPALWKEVRMATSSAKRHSRVRRTISQVMVSVKDYNSPSREVTMQGPSDYKDIPRRMRLEYDFPSAEKSHEMLDQISRLLAHFRKSEMDLRELITDAANFIAKQFSFKAVAIGLRGSDGIYRYEVLIGLRHEAEVALKKLTYTYEQFTDPTIYKGTMISKYTKVFLAEDNPWLDSERDTFDMPSLLGTSRKSLNDYVEGDYTNVHILGKDDEIIGWIEFSITTSRKMPDMSSIRWIEVIGQIIAAAVVSNPEGITRKST